MKQESLTSQIKKIINDYISLLYSLIKKLFQTKQERLTNQIKIINNYILYYYIL